MSEYSSIANNPLDIGAIYNLKLRKTEPNSTDSCTTKLNAKFPWPVKTTLMHFTYNTSKTYIPLDFFVFCPL
jgi:hypothetical protein